MSVGDRETLENLNVILKNELTAINQYFLHARMMKHMGCMKLADYEYKESIQQMKYADNLVERILRLGGIPNLQDMENLRVGGDVESILRCDLVTERSAESELSKTLSLCQMRKDEESADIIKNIMKNKEERISFIENQLNLIDSMGLSQYLQTHT